MDSILPFVLALSNHLVPGHDHTAFATALAKKVDSERPLFANDEDKKRTAAFMIAVDYREGTLGVHVEGDFVKGKPTSWCTAQINLPGKTKTPEGWTGEELRDDFDKCIAVQFRMLKKSISICRDRPLAWYVEGGVHACTSTRAFRISNDRMNLAKRLLKVSVSPRGDKDLLAKDEK